MPKRGVVRFGKRGKLSSRFIGPFEILERIGVVASNLRRGECKTRKIPISGKMVKS